MKILFCCGGTAGHINPALAVAGTIRSRHPEYEIKFAGTPYGMENQLVAAAGFFMYKVNVRGFIRKVSLKNIDVAKRLLLSLNEAGKILKEFQPDIVIGTGGYVSYPILHKAQKMGIKTAVHEQNAFPGIATKLLAKRADAIMLAVPQAQKYFEKFKDRCHITGNPIREEIIYLKKAQARTELGLDSRPVVLSFGGSLGAKRINEGIADFIAYYAPKKQIQHLHATGRFGWVWMPNLLKNKGVDLQKNPQIRVSEYIFDMPICLAACDIVICRAGAITLSEIEAQGKPSILIPSPNVAENHQYHNAMALAEKGAAIVIEEKDFSGERLICEVNELIGNPEKLMKMSKSSQELAILDSNDRIYSIVMELMK